VILYNILKFVHIGSAIVLLGGLHLALQLNIRFMRAGNLAAIAELNKQRPKIQASVLIPNAVLLMITGVGMVQVANLSWKQLWIIWGIAGWTIGIVTGSVIIATMAKRMQAAIASGQLTGAAAEAAGRRIGLVAMFNLLNLFVVVFMMVFKPV